MRFVFDEVKMEMCDVRETVMPSSHSSSAYAHVNRWVSDYEKKNEI